MAQLPTAAATPVLDRRGQASCTATISAASQQTQVLATLKPWLFGLVSAGPELLRDGFEAAAAGVPDDAGRINPSPE